MFDNAKIEKNKGLARESRNMHRVPPVAFAPYDIVLPIVVV